MLFYYIKQDDIINFFLFLGMICLYKRVKYMLTMSKIYSNFNCRIYSNFLMAHLNSYANVATLFANIDSIKKYPEFTEVCEFIRYADWNSLYLEECFYFRQGVLKKLRVLHTRCTRGARAPHSFLFRNNSDSITGCIIAS